MYKKLLRLHEKPEPFSRYTTDIIWTDPHIAGQMLRNHLNPETDHASRRATAIDRIVAWIDRKVGLAGKCVCDLGCGPGLYAVQMAERQARVTGIDFSANSIDYARNHASAHSLPIEYLNADYLVDKMPEKQDCVSLIYGDLCTLSPEQRKGLYYRIRRMLKPGGVFVFDVFTTQQFATLKESTTFARKLMDGFWSAEDYFGFCNAILYPEQKVSLDHYLIVEPDRHFEIFNWMQYFDPETITAEICEAGFEVLDVLDVATGAPWTASPRELAVVARTPGQG